MHRLTVRLGACLALAALSAPATAQCDDYVLQPTAYASGPNPSGLAFGDLDGDALVDAVVTEYLSENVEILLGTAGGFAAPVAAPGGSRPVAVAIGDLDGDLDRDIAICNEGYLGGSGWTAYGFTALWNSGGSFRTSTFFPLPTGQIQPSDIALGDFDGDADLDVALVLKGTGTNQSKLAAFVNDGSGGFGAASVAPTAFDPIALALGDLNGDQILDAVTVNYTSGTMSILYGTGSGTFTLVFGHATGYYPTDVSLGDFDGDGDLDGAISYRYGVHVLHNNAGILDWFATLAAGTFPYSVACADLDGDGDVDIASTDGLGDTLSLWDGDGIGSFAPRTSFVVGDNPFGLAPFDVDLDGDLDLGLVAYLDDGFVVLDNTCALSTYCAGKPNSLGCTPSIGSTGTPSLTGPDDFHVTASQELANKTGVVFLGFQSASLPFAGGTLCVKPPLKRTAVQSSGGSGACTGIYDYHLTNAWLLSKGWGAGIDAFAQYWGRDPQHPDGSGVSLSNALRFVLQP